MRIIFMGTPEFAIPSLDALVQNGHSVVLAVTQQDKPQDRGRAVKAPPVKQRATELGIPVLQPQRLSRQPEMVDALRVLEPDLIVTCAFGQLLPQSVLDIPRLGTVNVHGSLLPLLRGAAPIQRAILDGLDRTGITTMMTDIGMDTGDMLLKKEMPIDPDMTVGELHDRLSVIGAELLVETLRQMEYGTLERTPQDEALATIAPKVTRDTGHVDWTMSTETIHRLVRGTNPWPGAWSLCGSERMRIWWTDRRQSSPNGDTADALDEQSRNSVPGSVLMAGRQGLLVRSGDGAVLVTEIQMPNGKRMAVDDYLRGHAIAVGTVLT